MKKGHYLPVLIFIIFVLLCACTQQVTDQPDTTPSSSSAALQSKPVTKPTTKPTTAPTTKPTTAPTQPTQPTTAPTQPTTAPTQPTTAPTQPTTLPTVPTQPTAPTYPVNPATDWIVEDREIIPFEDRFKENVPFSLTSSTRSDTAWFAQGSDDSYGHYLLGREATNPGVLTIYHGNRNWNDPPIWRIPLETDLTGYTTLTADGRWAFLASDDNVMKVDLLTKECTVILTRDENAVRWEIQVCGKDTICIFALDAGHNLRVCYRDLHSDAEKELFNDTIPATPDEDLKFYGPRTTLGKFTVQMMNPAFYDLMQAEIRKPDSQFKNDFQHDYSKYWNDPDNANISIYRTFFLCVRVQDHYNVPARVNYIYDIKTGRLTPDYGIIDSCERGSGDYNDHFNYENTWKTPLIIAEPDPVVIPSLSRLTKEAVEAGEILQVHTGNFFGYSAAYVYNGNRYFKVADIAICAAVSGPGYIYCITPENTLVQLSYDGSIQNTIYTSENTLSQLFYDEGNLYFVDGDSIIRIDLVEGTRSVILRCTGSMSLDVWSAPEYLYVLVVQGLYNQQYFFNPYTGALTPTAFI